MLTALAIVLIGGTQPIGKDLPRMGVYVDGELTYVPIFGKPMKMIVEGQIVDAVSQELLV